MGFVVFASVSLCQRSLWEKLSGLFSFSLSVCRPLSLSNRDKQHTALQTTGRNVHQSTETLADDWQTLTNSVSATHKHTLTTLLHGQTHNHTLDKQIHNSSWLCTVWWTMTSIKTDKMWPKMPDILLFITSWWVSSVLSEKLLFFSSKRKILFVEVALSLFWQILISMMFDIKNPWQKQKLNQLLIYKMWITTLIV